MNKSTTTEPVQPTDINPDEGEGESTVINYSAKLIYLF
jgi:hypothetical protein